MNKSFSKRKRRPCPCRQTPLRTESAALGDVKMPRNQAWSRSSNRQHHACRTLGSGSERCTARSLYCLSSYASLGASRVAKTNQGRALRKRVQPQQTPRTGVSIPSSPLFVSASANPRNSRDCCGRSVKRDLQIAILASAKVESGWHPPPARVSYGRSRDREDQDGRRHFDSVRASTHCR
jgi:hypothetical protein